MKKHKQNRRKTTKHQAAKRKHRKSSGGGRPPVREWVGGRFLAPFHVDEETPYQPVFEVWVELPLELVVHFEIHNPEEPIPAVAEGLRDKLSETTAALRPRRLRLDDPDWAADVQRMLPMLKVVSGPTPELEPVLDELVTAMEEDAPPATYLDEGRLPATAMASLFEAAAALFRLAPWTSIGDAPIIEVTIPELDVHGACISVIGTLGESFGFLLFESFEASEALFEVAEALEEGLEVEGFGTSVTSLNFERGADLPPSMRREVQEHGWPVAAAKAYPVVEHRDSSGFPRSASEHELRIMTACTEVLVTVFEKHGSRFAADETPEFSETHVDSQGHEVLVKVPPDGWLTDDELPPIDSMDVFELGNLLLAALLTYATDRWDDRIPQRIERLLREPHEESIAIHFGLYQLIVEDGKTVSECFLEDIASTLHERARRWLDAQGGAWLSLWEVTDVDPGESLELHDVLTGEVRRVADKMAADSVRKHTTLLAKVAHFEGEDLLIASHPQALPPMHAHDLTERVRKYLRPGPVTPDRLRDPNAGRYLIRHWQEESAELYGVAEQKPLLRNTDGDALVRTVDRYAFDARQRGKVESKLAALKGVERDLLGQFLFLAADGGRNTVLGWVELDDETLRIESNSVARADDLRGRVEDACAGLISHRGRTHEDGFAALNPGQPPAESDFSPQEEESIIQAYKQQFYEDWLDDVIPALDNKTPREAARSKAGRARVTALINQIEYNEASLPAGQRYDVAALREALNIDQKV